MTKLLIVGFTKITYMPYLHFYLESLKDVPVEIHIVSWRRDTERDLSLKKVKVVVHEFCCNQKDEVPKISKIKNFIKYRKFVIGLLRKSRFDRVIVLHTLPAVLIADKLLRKYRGSYILDYRDYTYESSAPFKGIVWKLVNASYATFVSSDAFREELPKLDKVYTSHNLLLDSLNHRCTVKEICSAQLPVRIAFWGFIRHEKINRILIEALGNDGRFELHYYGREQETAKNLKLLVREKQLTNVFFHGTYYPDERYKFAQHTDIIHNMYENDVATQKAMGNKYYDGVIFRIPQICTKGSYMGNRVEEDGVGKAFDPLQNNLADQLYNYYFELDRIQFEKNCNKTCNKILNEYNNGKLVVRYFVEEISW